ncbi:hypothetical protein [Pseudotabrizicola sediminis]|uniref:hypothetical protein n=1 Tax=Pseudotabrizicola sediminis TaxID=2486418 RepID=UPI0010816BAA|nr:hypothetical protein [Pseudotabrizicola sediminis]
MRILSAVLLAALPATASAQLSDGAIIRCGASSGHSFFFKGTMNPSGPNWDADGISSGKIVLIRLGDEWDIQFDDFAGSSGYRQDGAKVFPLMETDSLLTVGAFNAQYVDIYTFDLANKVVGWTSNKHGPITPKSAAYSATCD